MGSLVRSGRIFPEPGVRFRLDLKIVRAGGIREFGTFHLSLSQDLEKVEGPSLRWGSVEDGVPRLRPDYDEDSLRAGQVISWAIQKRE